MAVSVAGATPQRSAVGSNVISDASWALSAQLPDGSIASYVDHAQISPYLANFAAMGLARATEVSGAPVYADGAWRWLAWYQAHEGANGFVTDYRVLPDGSLVSTGDFDSTDAYAGTFLLAARRTWIAAPDLSRLSALRTGIVGAIGAIETTQDTDGLTWAKPAWHVKYLMDQAETYAGLRAGADLAAALGDVALQQRASADAVRMASGVSGLWDPATGAYDWAVHASGARQTTDWSVLYPDSQQQMWAVAFGLALGSRARALVDTFDVAQPNWDQPAATARIDSGLQPVGYWPVTGWAYGRVGRMARSLRAATNIRSAASAANFAWPFASASAGQLIQLESADPKILGTP